MCVRLCARLRDEDNDAGREDEDEQDKAGTLEGGRTSHSVGAGNKLEGVEGGVMGGIGLRKLFTTRFALKPSYWSATARWRAVDRSN